jgi:hypothetical protein
MRFLRLILVVFLASTYANFTLAEEKLWYGLLHAHTSFSDGSGVPEDAYKEAKQNGLDFFAVTEHNHAAAESSAGDRKDGILIAKDHSLYNSPDLVTTLVKGKERKAKSLVRAAQDATSGKFLAIYGQEFSTISSGNHMNVLGIGDVITVENGKYRALYESLDSSIPLVLQMNHPDVQGDLFYRGSNADELEKMFNDYGLDEFGKDFSQLVAASDKYVALIEVLSGPMATKDSKVEEYRYDAHGDDYYFYLTQGFHVSPSAGHDNHYQNWGDKSPARTGVYAESLTLSSIFQAMQINRTFATEDSDMAVGLNVNGVPMGGVVSLGQDLPLEIIVDFKDGAEDSTGYEITLIYGSVEPQMEGGFERWRESDGMQETKTAQGNGAVRFDGYISGGGPEFFYALIEQDDGNRAWTAPVWINHPRGTSHVVPIEVENFVWTKNNSRYYHHPWCASVGKILDMNRQNGNTPPSDRELHNCVRSAVNPVH